MILAIDPGPEQSAFCFIDPDRRPVRFGKLPNDDVLQRPCQTGSGRAVIEQVESYGMAVGREVFDTCIWAGRFYQQLVATGYRVELIPRRPVKLHHCGSARAKDGNLVQAMVDRFAPGQPNHGKGTKGAPGWFYGFRADIWQAYALAVYAADTGEVAAA